MNILFSHLSRLVLPRIHRNIRISAIVIFWEWDLCIAQYFVSCNKAGLIAQHSVTNSFVSVYSTLQYHFLLLVAGSAIVQRKEEVPADGRPDAPGPVPCARLVPSTCCCGNVRPGATHHEAPNSRRRDSSHLPCFSELQPWIRTSSPHSPAHSSRYSQTKKRLWQETSCWIKKVVFRGVNCCVQVPTYRIFGQPRISNRCIVFLFMYMPSVKPICIHKHLLDSDSFCFDIWVSIQGTPFLFHAQHVRTRNKRMNLICYGIMQSKKLNLFW